MIKAETKTIVVLGFTHRELERFAAGRAFTAVCNGHSLTIIVMGGETNEALEREPGN